MKKFHLLPTKAFSSYEEYFKEIGSNAISLAKNMKPLEIIKEIGRAGLRGRGGAGFPTATKWRSIFSHPCKVRYVVCNAAEGEPGTFKDRFLIRKNPYALLEGLLIASQVIQPKEIYIGIKSSFVLEIKRLREAIREFEEKNLSNGQKITLIEGPEEYLFGEEKALLRFIEEGSPLPREPEYPPYERGLFSTPDSPNPALVNNVETFAHIPHIIRKGAESFRKLGTDDTPGTILFTLSGDIKKPGVYELEAGIKLNDLLFEIGGGGCSGKICAVVSGVSSGVIPPEKFNTPCDFGHLSMIGSGLGSAGFVVFDETKNIPRILQSLARFLYVESCNQCTACKHGLRMASKTLDSLFNSPSPGDSESLEKILYGAKTAPQGNRCYLPVEGSILIPSFINRFRREFEQQLTSKVNKTKTIPVPILKDFDEKTRTFTYDLDFQRKNSDWTYKEEMSSLKRKKSVKPARQSSGHFGVRLAPDVMDLVLRHTKKSKGELDEVVNQLLRDCLKIK